MKTPEFGQELEEGPILTDTAVKLFAGNMSNDDRSVSGYVMFYFT